MFFSGKKYVSYTRKVPWRAAEEAVGLSVQQEAIQDYIRARGGVLLQEYSDPGDAAGADEAFRQMEADAASADHCDCVVIYSLYYGGASFQAVKRLFLETLPARGISFAVVKDSFDSADHSPGEIQGYFEAQIHKLHGDVFREWRRSKGAGFVLTNSVPYGYVRPNGASHLSKDGETAPYVQEIFAQFAAGKTAGQIAEWLNEAGADTPMMRRQRLQGAQVQPQKWNQMKVIQLLRNPVYTGGLVNKKRELLAEGCHEAYLSMEEFRALPGNDKVGTPRRQGRKKRTPEESLPFKLVCGECGTLLRRKWDRESGRGYYCCSRCRLDAENSMGQDLSAEGAACRKIWEKDILHAVVSILRRERDRALVVEERLQNGLGQKEWEVYQDDLALRTRDVLAELEEEQLQRVPLYEKRRNGEISQEEYESRLGEYQRNFLDLDRVLETVLEDVKRRKLAYSLKNPWVLLFAHAELPKEPAAPGQEMSKGASLSSESAGLLDRETANRLIDKVELYPDMETVFRKTRENLLTAFLDQRTVEELLQTADLTDWDQEIALLVHVKKELWRQLLPDEWLSERRTDSDEGRAGKGRADSGEGRADKGRAGRRKADPGEGRAGKRKSDPGEGRADERSVRR